jgi:hypothetical protein
MRRLVVLAAAVLLLGACGATPGGSATPRSAHAPPTASTPVTAAPLPSAAPPRVHPTGGEPSGTFTLAGPVSGVTSQILVSLPAGYDDPANASRRYPVIEAFPGWPGTLSGLATGFALRPTLDSLAAAHQIRNAILVLAYPWVPAGRDTECVNGPGGRAAGDQVETWLTVDVPQWVRTHLRAAAAATSWATFGISAGAWCAAMASLRHPSVYRGAIVLGGYFWPQWGYWRPYGAYGRYLPGHNLVVLEKKSPVPVAMWAYTSVGDPFSYPTTTQFSAVVRAPTQYAVHVAASGKHSSSQWKPWLSTALRWLAHAEPGFAP